MARSIKCKRCGKTLLPEERYKYDNNSYCVDCYKKVERDANEYKELMRYIFDAAMTYTLWYCKEILGKSFDIKYGIYIIEDYYNEACDFYIQQEKQKEQADKISKLDIKTKIVNRKSVNMNKTKSSTSLINLGDLIEGGDSN